MRTLAADDNWCYRQTLRHKKASLHGSTGIFKSFRQSSLCTTFEEITLLGHTGNDQRWINNLVKDRQQQVVFDNATSSTTPITSWVPHGTVFGLRLFLIYIKDITDNIIS